MTSSHCVMAAVSALTSTSLALQRLKNPLHVCLREDSLAERVVAASLTPQ